MAKLNGESVTSGSGRVTLQGEAASNVLGNHGVFCLTDSFEPRTIIMTRVSLADPEMLMKNLLSLTAAFVVAVCLSSPSFAADKNADQSTPTTAKTAPTKVEPSATKVAHDGSIDDI